MRVNLSENILPHFRKLFKSILDFEFFRIVLKGGRSSGKSVFVAESIIVGTLIHKRSAVAIIRYKIDVTKRLDNVFIKALNFLQLRDKFRYISTKHEFVLLDKYGSDTDISIVCTGADDPEQLKGMQPKLGSYWCLWVEEATNFQNIKNIQNIESTILRGDLLHATSIISYNPRQNSNHFLNKEYENIVDNVISYEEDADVNMSVTISQVAIEDIEFKQCVMHCTYKSLIKYNHRDWIAATDLVAISYGESINSEYYRWYYLGKCGVISDVAVFRNVRDWDGNTEHLNILHIDRALDVGNGGKDPFHYVEVYFDKKERNLYILAEYNDKGGDTIIQRVADNIHRINKNNLRFKIDSAVPLIATQLKKEHLQPVPVKKFQGSVDAGILFLQSLQGIYISKALTPVTYKEFSEYEYVIDKYEEVTNELPDKDNHSIDATRYACYDYIVHSN